MGTVSPFEGVSEPPTNSVTTSQGVGGGGVSEGSQFAQACEALLTKSNSVTAVAWNPKRQQVAVANGDVVDIFDPIGKTASVSFNLGGLDETPVVLAFYSNYLYAASANDSKILNISTDVITTLGTVEASAALIGSTQDDTNPAWQGVDYTLPGVFLIEASAPNFTIYSLASGAPVSDRVEPLANVTSLDYREGQVYAGTFAAGMDQYDYVLGTIVPYKTTTTPAIVNDSINDVAATVLDFVDTTNLLSDTDNPSTQSVTVGADTYTLGFDGDGSVTLSGAATGSLSGDDWPQQERQWLTFDATAGSLTLTLSGDVRNIQLEQSATPHDYVSSVVGPTTGQTRPAKKVRIRSNELHDSNDFSSATWSRFASGGGLPAVDTPTSEEAPTGELATHLFFDASSGESVIRYNFASSWPYSTAVLSLYAKFPVGQSFYMRWDWLGGSNFELKDGTGDWVRYELEAPPAFTGTNVSCQFGAVPAAGSSAVLDMLVASAQAEEGLNGAAEGYIPAISAPTFKTEDTGLFIPTWHVETAASVSVGLDNGSIPDITGLTTTDFGGWLGQEVVFTDTVANVVYRGPVPDADIAVGAWNTAAYDAVTTTSPYFLPTTVSALDAGDALYIGSDGGFSVIDDPIFALATITYNTGYMREPDGAWANDNDGTTLVAPATLPDNSGQANDATVVGTLTKEPFSDVFGVIVSDVDGFTATVTPGGQLIGWEKTSAGSWRFRRDATEFINASETAGTLSVFGAVDGSAVAMVRWNATPMTQTQLDQTERDEKCIAANTGEQGSAFSEGFDEGFD